MTATAWFRHSGKTSNLGVSVGRGSWVLNQGAMPKRWKLRNFVEMLHLYVFWKATMIKVHQILRNVCRDVCVCAYLCVYTHMCVSIHTYMDTYTHRDGRSVRFQWFTQVLLTQRK